MDRMELMKQIERVLQMLVSRTRLGHMSEIIVEDTAQLIGKLLDDYLETPRIEDEKKHEERISQLEELLNKTVATVNKLIDFNNGLARIMR